jgi:hypothetical protein
VERCQFRMRCQGGDVGVVFDCHAAETPIGMEPSQSKRAFFKAEQCHASLAALYPRSVLIPTFLNIDERAKTVKDFMSEHAIGYLVVAKPDRGRRSFGAYRVDGEAGLKCLLGRLSNELPRRGVLRRH